MCKSVQEYAEKYAEKYAEEYAERKIREELAALVKDGLLNISDAAKRLNMTEDEFKKRI